MAGYGARLAMALIGLSLPSGPAQAQVAAAQPTPAGPAAAAGGSEPTPLVVVGKRRHRPTWRGPQGRPLKAPPESWGKAGVSLADYRAEAADCTRRAYYLDISKTPEVDALARADRRIESLNDQANLSSDPSQAYANIARERQAANYETKQESLEEMMQATVDRCLSEHGYRRFRLTDAQRKELGKLAFGSEARRTYLYSLASDPAVLAAQSDDAPTPSAPKP